MFGALLDIFEKMLAESANRGKEWGSSTHRTDLLDQLLQLRKEEHSKDFKKWPAEKRELHNYKIRAIHEFIITENDFSGCQIDVVIESAIDAYMQRKKGG